MRPLLVFAFTLAMLASLSSGATADVDGAHERLDHRLAGLIEAKTSAAISRSIERRVELLNPRHERSSRPRSKSRSGSLRPSPVATSTLMRCVPSARHSLECLVVPMSSRGFAARPAPQ